VDKSYLTKLYTNGSSMAEIADTLQCSVHKVQYWMDKYNLKRRSRSVAQYRKLNPNGDPFSIKTELSKKQTFLHGLGLGIYMGEGEKVSKSGIRVANSDPYIIKLFREFLIDICQADIKKISYSLVCFNDTKPEAAAQFWSHALNIQNIDFGKIVSIPVRGKGTYKRKSFYGVCTVSFHNMKLKSWIMEQIKNPFLAFSKPE